MNRFRSFHPGGNPGSLLFSSCRALRQTENAVREALEERGYSEIITPAVEYFDVFAQANPELDQDQMLKIIDKSGRICVARPDNTTPIARIAATRLDDAALPVRLYYSQKVFRSVSGDHGHKGEFLQVGAEFIGADGLEADKDILSAAFAALSKTGADNFRVELGHAEIYKALMDELGADAQSAEGIRRLIENKSFAALGDALEPFKGKPAAKALSAMPNLFGGIEVLDEVESLTGNVRVLGATAYLRRLYQALDEAGYGDRIMIDLGLVHEMDYYTGIMFRGYIGGAGAAILSGGRYNALCAKFGKDMPAGGFGIDVESVAESLAGASRPEVATRRDTVRIALTEGPSGERKRSRCSRPQATQAGSISSATLRAVRYRSARAMSRSATASWATFCSRRSRARRNSWRTRSRRCSPPRPAPRSAICCAKRAWMTSARCSIRTRSSARRSSASQSRSSRRTARPTRSR